MKRVLVTGSEGALGRAFVRRLKSAGRVSVVAFPKSRLDVAAPEAAKDAVGRVKPDVVLNCAARSDPLACEGAAWETFRVNRDGADRVARACVAHGALPVYFSTDLVFDGGRLQPYREEDAPNPLNLYGESKLAGELRTASASRTYLIVRTGWLFGQTGGHFLSGLTGSKPFSVIETQIGQATYIEDFVDAVLFLLKEGRTGRWHVASPGAVTQEGVVRKAREWTKRKGPVAKRRPADALPRLPAASVLDIAKLHKAGFAMRPWEEGLKDYLKKK